MRYSIIGILAAIILVIINRDVLWKDKEAAITPARKSYRWFLYGVMAYYITDILWGILESHDLTAVLYFDTAVQFTAMAAAVMLWTRYVIAYLEEKNLFVTILHYAGGLFLIFEILVVAVNIFRPVLFWFDDTGAYQAGVLRYVTLAIQIILFLMTSAYTMHVTNRTEGKVKRRHFTIGLFGIAMTLLICIQVFYPLLPFYAMGYMLGTCVLHSFAVEDEKEEYRRELEQSTEREHLQTEELSQSRHALSEALAAAENANRAKTAFLSNMSHEIRTPMNAIIGLNNIAMNEPGVSSNVMEYLEKIGSSAQHLLGIINDILDMSRIESGRMTIMKEEFSFSRSLEQVNMIIIGQCEEKNLSYDCTIKGNIDDYYIGDAMKLKQVLINILGNAVKFTPEGGNVSFMIEEGTRYDNKAVLKFIISDNGIGMSEEYLPHLFDAFSQEDSSATSTYGSTGLGMPITKSIVELMNGTIDVESEKGKGTTFTVTVTLGQSDRVSAETEAGDINPADLSGRHVLLAEDVAINAEIIMMVLSMREIDVDLAENGRIAVEKFAEHEAWYYDAILMDMRMPEMDGLEATRIIRSMERADAKAIPVIALTANAFDEDVERSMQAGLNAHLSKLVEPELLFETLETLINQNNKGETRC